MLADNQAQIAINCRLTNGELQSLLRNLVVDVPNISGTIKTIYRINDVFVAWNRDVNAAKGPIAGDASYRTYFTGAGEPRVTNYALATTAKPYPTAFYVLGVFQPVTAPSVTHAGGTGAAVSRAFQYTFVTPWGEESAPSPASAVVTGKTDGTWTIGATTAMDVAPLNSYNVTGVAWGGGYLTFTCTSTFGLRAGEYVNNTLFAPDSLNGEQLVYDVPSATTFRVAMAADPTVTDGVGTATRVAPHNTASMTKRIYWTDNGSYWLVKENIAVATTSDTVAGDTANGAAMTCTNYHMPPATMTGLISLPNGMMAGFAGNELRLSEPWFPHAWPFGYRQTTDYPIVGIGSFGTTIVIGTTGTPYLVGGSSPDGMSMEQIANIWPCLAKRGMVSGDGGVMYPTTGGLAFIGAGGANLITRSFYTQYEWMPLVPSTFIAALHDSQYFACYTDADHTDMLILDAGNGILSESIEAITAIWNDPETGKLYVASGIQILEWEGDPSTRKIYDWMSKEFLTLPPINLAAAKIDADFSMTPEEIVAAQTAYDAAVITNQVRIGAASIVSIGGTTNTSAIVTGLSSTADLYESLNVTGTGIPASTRIKSIDSASQITLTAAATATGTPSLSFTGDSALLYGALGFAPMGTYPLGGDALTSLPLTTFDSLTYSLFVGGLLKFTRQVTDSKAFSLPGGYKSDAIAHRLAGNVKVSGIVVAESMQGLRNA
ncbi:MAG: hypothetical protein A2V79_09200 [Betaproteobacteria bacterium RBG_16_56_24]|nr:MAG: hypothetical protein A2V79_09200 [Betaproteobacteria bacterium RBG_16_56_24]